MDNVASVMEYMPSSGEISRNALHDHLKAIAHSQRCPSSGSASALIGAISAALVEMVARANAKEKAFGVSAAPMTMVASDAAELVGGLTEGIERDTKTCEAIASAIELPTVNFKEESARRRAIQSALRQAVDTQLYVATRSAQSAALARRLLVEGISTTRTDATSAILIAASAIESACLSASENLCSIKDTEYTSRSWRDITKLLDKARAARAEMYAVLSERMPD